MGEELARAYKKSDEDKAKAQNQVIILEKEITKLKAEFEKRFGGARDEYEGNKKKMVDEVNILSRKLAEAESRLKNEVEVIKKKMSITITELEMSLDGSNKSNVQLQNTCKVQGEKIMQLTAAYSFSPYKSAKSCQEITFYVLGLLNLLLCFTKKHLWESLILVGGTLQVYNNY